MFNIIIFGAPGSGKGTQSEKIIKEYNLEHISTGDVLRAEINAQTDLGKIAAQYIEKGQLVPDDLIISILASVFDSKKHTKGVIFDGFPRTIPQAKALKEMLAERHTQINAVIALEVADAELTERLLNRGKISGRSDDNLETIKKRLQVYHSQTAPLIEYYKEEKLYHAVEGSGSIDEIFSHIKKIIDCL